MRSWVLLLCFVGHNTALNPIKLCTVPNLKGSSVSPGALVYSDSSLPLDYRCGGQSYSTHCSNGQWTPTIDPTCIDTTCVVPIKLQRKVVRPVQGPYPSGANITMKQCSTNNRHLKVTVHLKCTSQGYWLPNTCDSGLKCGRSRRFRGINDHLAQKVELSDSIKRIVFCPKGKQMTTGTGKKQPGESQWYLYEGDVVSGLPVNCSENNLSPVPNDYECTDLNECKEMSKADRAEERQRECEANEAASGNGQNDDGSEDTETNCAEDMYLEERGIKKCHHTANCRNKDPGFECKCDDHLVEQEHDGSCLFIVCRNLTNPRNGDVVVIQKRQAIFSCKPHFKMREEEEYMCIHGNWTTRRHRTRMEKAPTCMLDTSYCGAPAEPLNGYIRGLNLELDTRRKLQYFCNDGYTLHGPEERICKRGGYWSNYQPVCKKTLPVLTTIGGIREKYVDAHSNRTVNDFTLPTGERAHVGDAFGIDLYFLIDTSASIGSQDMLNKELCLCITVVRELFAGGKTDITRIGVISFGGGVVVHLDLDDPAQHNEAQIRRKIKSIKFTGGGTPLKDAFTKVLIADGKHGNRAENKKFVILITDGVKNLKQDPLPQIIILQRKYYEIMTIGLGQNIDEANLREMAKPNGDFYHLHDGEEIDELVDEMFETKKENELCGFAGDTKLIDPPGFIRGKRKMVAEGAFPWLVALFTGTTKFLGSGNLICNKWILTSKRTIQDPEEQPIAANNLEVVAGIHYLFNSSANKPANIQTVGVKRVVLHPNEDLALLELSTNIRFTDYARPICVASMEGSIFGRELSSLSGQHARFTGWGAEQLSNFKLDKTSKVLQLHECPVQEAIEEQEEEYDYYADDEEDGGIIDGEPEDGVEQPNPEEAEEDEQVPANWTRATNICSGDCDSCGGRYEMCKLDQGGALMYRVEDKHDTDRFVAVAVATPGQDCGKGRFRSLLDQGAWIHKTTNECSKQHLKDDNSDAHNENHCD